MTSTNKEERTLELPDTTLAFFAYGIFKPGQLAYSKIRNHVNDAEMTGIDYRMKHRDGVPILVRGENSRFHTEGALITFKDGHGQQAYKAICNTMLRKLYEWECIEIDGKKVNVLFGVNPDNGSNEIEDAAERISFDGKRDPLFSEAIRLIEDNLNSSSFSWDMENFFKLQMNYMLLWSAIDRFSGIKYNKKEQNRNNEKFARQKSFRQSIKKFEDKPHRPVYSTDDLKDHIFNADDSYETFKYYYTIRCNVVHRGKAMVLDYEMLRQATEELLEIFKDVLKDTFII